jgi:glucokinase
MLGVSFQPASIRMGLVPPSGAMRDTVETAVTNRTPHNTVSLLIEAVRGYLRDKEKPAAIGIGLPGYVNLEKGLWMHCLRMGIHTPIAVAAAVEQAFSLPVRIDNDLNAATLAENRYGMGRMSRDFLYVLVDDAVAMGIVSGGRLVRGVANCAGELGHVSTDPDGARCECNARGCLEGIVARERIVTETARQLADWPQSALAGLSPLTVERIFDAAQQGDELACLVAGRAVKSLGLGLVSSVNLLNPEQIVLTGRTSQHPWFTAQVKKFVYANGFVSSLATLRDISPSALNEEYTGVLGAACLCPAPL